VAQLELPEPTGPYAVGRTSRSWSDVSRLEILTVSPDDYREVPVEIWYPAEDATGTATRYFMDLEHVALTLAASGEVSPIEVFGLRFIRSHGRLEALLPNEANSYPLILLSPGNGTNVEFYSGIADELASHGYIVVALNHPYDVAAVALQDGRVAQFDPGPFELQANQLWVRDRIAVRTADVLFALDRLREMNEGEGTLFAGRLDLARVGIMGHSLGGITAAQACIAASQFRACLNLDGLAQGGPFSASENPIPPDQPFMMITKEQKVHPAIASLFAAISSGSYRVVIMAATHDSFTDGPLLLPSLLPMPSQADHSLSLIRAYTLAFLDQTLRAQPSSLLEELVQEEQVLLEVYPSR
jgi:predicted dienelactone hydrolase